MMFAKGSRAGFTLVEMSVVLLLIATMTGGVLAIMNAQLESSGYVTTRYHMNAIEDALSQYVERTGYLPCVAPPDAAEESATFGIAADCTAAAPASIIERGAGENTIWIGTVPTRSLNLPDEYFYDGWGNRFTFALIKDLATTADSYENYATTATTGVINILDYNGNQIPDASTKSIIAYTLISHGKDKKGAYSKAGTITIACSAGSKDGANCDGTDAIFRASDVVDSPTATRYYDDIVSWKSQDVLSEGEVAATEDSTFTAEDRLDNGNLYSCAIEQNGIPYCWGNDNAGSGSTNNGRLGVGASGGTYATSPGGQVGGASGYTDWDIIKTDWQFTCGIRGGKLYCWGGNCASGGHPGCLGLNQASGTYNVNTPTQITSPNFTDWAKLDVDGFHACAIRSTGALYCWGRNDSGQVGDNTAADRRIPTQVRDSAGTGNWTDWNMVSIGQLSSCGLRNNRLFCWGENGMGELGDGTTADKSLPTEVSGLYADWVYVGGGHSHFCGIRNGNRAYCWGSNASGQIGTGSAGGTILAPSLVTGSITDWKKIKPDNDSTCGLTYAGAIQCWGGNTQGELGDNNAPTARYTPGLIVGGSSGWIDIAHHCGIKSDRKAYCWFEHGNSTNVLSPQVLPGLTF